MAILIAQRISGAGSTLAMAAAGAGGDSFQNEGRTYFRAKNAGAAAITLSFDSPNTCNFKLGASAAHDETVVVPNDSALYEVGPFDPARFNDANGRVQVTYSSNTNMTVAVVSA